MHVRPQVRRRVSPRPVSGSNRNTYLRLLAALCWNWALISKNSALCTIVNLHVVCLFYAETSKAWCLRQGPHLLGSKGSFPLFCPWLLLAKKSCSKKKKVGSSYSSAHSLLRLLSPLESKLNPCSDQRGLKWHGPHFLLNFPAIYSTLALGVAFNANSSNLPRIFALRACLCLSIWSSPS